MRHDIAFRFVSLWNFDLYRRTRLKAEIQWKIFWLQMHLYAVKIHVRTFICHQPTVWNCALCPMNTNRFNQVWIPTVSLALLDPCEKTIAVPSRSYSCRSYGNCPQNVEQLVFTNEKPNWRENVCSIGWVKWNLVTDGHELETALLFTVKRKLPFQFNFNKITLVHHPFRKILDAGRPFCYSLWLIGERVSTC